jgi:hypothetical protein
MVDAYCTMAGHTLGDVLAGENTFLYGGKDNEESVRYLGWVQYSANNTSTA